MFKAKLDEDYQNFNQQIGKLAQEAIRVIQEKANAIREEANRTGQAVESVLDQKQPKASRKKKVNS